MERKDLYRLKMQEIDASNRIFQSGWRRLRPNHSAGETYRLLAQEYRRREQDVVDLYKLLQPLRQPFLEGDHDAIDAVLDFLELDIPAFRVGYAKEWFYRRFKRLSLSEQHRSRLVHAAIALFSQPTYRREWRELSRLLIVIADTSVIDALERLSHHGENEFVRRRARLALEKVVSNSRRPR